MIGIPYNPDNCIFIASQSLNANQFNDNVPNAGNLTTHNLLWDVVNNTIIWVDTKTNLIVYEITSGGALPNNPYDFYLDGNVAIGGDGSAEHPFKTLTELNNAVLALPVNANSYTAIVLPYPTGYGNEVVGILNIAENLSLVGINAPNTTINCPIALTSTGLGTGSNVITYRNIAFNNIFTLDLALSTFAFVSFVDGQFNLQRIDNNVNAAVAIQGGVLTSYILGGVVTMRNCLIFSDVNVGPGSTLFAVNTQLYGGAFKLVGNSTLKTLSTINPTAGYVDGTVDGSGTPTWYTDESSDESYTGTLNKIVLGNGWQLDGNSNGSVKSIGTKDNYDFPIICNNQEVGRFVPKLPASTFDGDARFFYGQTTTDNGSNAGFQTSCTRPNRAQFRFNQYGANNAGGGITAFKSRSTTIGAPITPAVPANNVQVGDIIVGITGIGLTDNGAGTGLIPLAYTQRVVVVQNANGNVACDWEVSLCPLGGITNSIRKTFGFSSEGIQKVLESANAMAGLVLLDATGTAVIPNTNVKATTRFVLTAQDGGAVPTGNIYQSARTNGIDFTIKSTAGIADAGVQVYYQLYEQLT